MRTLLRAILLFGLPSRLAVLAANLLGYQVHHTARIGFSFISVDGLKMGPGTLIGHGNQIRGPFDVVMSERAKIGHFNTISRAAEGISVGKATLSMGVWSAVTARHRLDLCSSISIGNFSTVAGTGSQLWTHGYVHDLEGIGRYRIDGSIEIGNNVYIGTMCFISMGVNISDGIIVGGGSSVAKDLVEQGVYVSGPLRQLARPKDPDVRSDLTAVDPGLSCDRVYRKGSTP